MPSGPSCPRGHNASGPQRTYTAGSGYLHAQSTSNALSTHVPRAGTAAGSTPKLVISTDPGPVWECARITVSALRNAHKRARQESEILQIHIVTRYAHSAGPPSKNCSRRPSGLKLPDSLILFIFAASRNHKNHVFPST